MKHLSRSLPVILCILIAVVLHSGCKENTLINSKISPSDNAVGVYDTMLGVVTHTFYSDSAITSTNIGGISIFQGVGTYTDPFFGTMVGSTYFNLIPSEFNTLDGFIIDSAVLILPYSGFTYGDTVTTSITQTYQVFYVTQAMDINTTYYNNTSFPLDISRPLSAPTTFNVHNLQDSTASVLDQNHSGLRIPLNLPALKARLIPAAHLLAASTNPTTDFINAFTGICVQPANTQQYNTAYPYFQLDGASTYTEAGIMVYYHDTLGDTSSNLYYFNTGACAHFNKITKSYSRFPVNNLLHSTAANDQIVAIQNQPGTCIDVVIPGLSKLPVGIINKAELQFTVLPGYNNMIPTSGDSILFAPERMYPVGVGNGNYPVGIGSGLTYILSDRYPIYSNSPFNVIDGNMHLLNGKERFTVDIPREVMSSIAAHNDTIHLQIEGSQDFYGAFHLVAGGGSYPDTGYKAKLFVVYSKLKN